MSKASEKARAERRQAAILRGDVSGIPDVPPGEPGPPQPFDFDDAPNVHAVALIADAGGWRLAELSLPREIVEAHATNVTEAEVLQIQLALAAEKLEGVARGAVDAEGKPARRACPKCGAAALVRHPRKPADMCAACDAWIEVSA